jgi:CheY-like chemotaxis protein
MTSPRHIQKTILVVEDNDLARRQFALLLGGQGHEVVTVRDGREALDHLAANPAPDLVLLDMLMPVLDGWHFLEQVPRPHAPVLLVTSTILSHEWAGSHGCAGFLRKPVETADLLQAVARCLGQDESAAPR